MLSITNLCKISGQRSVCQIDNIEVKAGTIVGLFGANGAGKSTCFDMLAGLISASSGSIHLNEHDITKLPMHHRAQLGLGFLPQDSSIFQDLSIANNLNAVLELHRSARSIPTACRKLLEQFRLEKIAHTLGKNVSGGERRRTEIARAVAAKPKFLLLDEPFAGIDPIAVKDIMQCILQLSKNQGLGILITDHNARATLKLCDHAYIIHNGKILAQGNEQQLTANPEVIAHYLGSTTD